MSAALVFGASGAIGTAIAEALRADGHTVTGTSRNGSDELLAVEDLERLHALDALDPLDAVVWAQGANVNDSAAGAGLDSFEGVMAANVTFVVATLGHLLRSDRVRDGARLVVLSSIWQELARPGKFSYTISKAAVGGLVRAAAADLAERGILVNAVLPSVTDTPMTRSMLSAEQVSRVTAETGFARLTSLDDITGLVVHLCSQSNMGVTGQSIPVDLGLGRVRRL